MSGTKQKVFGAEFKAKVDLEAIHGVKTINWIKWFPDEDKRDSWTHRLANLVPLHVRKNPAASNFDFATKKNVYFKGKGTASPFILTQDVRSEDSWMPAMLAIRQKRLVGVLEKHWDLTVLDQQAAQQTTAQG